MEIPVIKNEDYKLSIHGLSHEGAGIGRIEGFTIFVEGALPGEEVEIKIVKVLSNHAFGKLLNIIKPSSNRVEPACSGYKRCGGCDVHHMNYEAQLRFKKQVVIDNLERIGGIHTEVLDTIGMENPYEYRNKCQYPVGMKDGKVISGFYASRSHEIIEENSCLIDHPKSKEIVEAVKEFIEKYKISVYDEKTNKGIVRHIVTRSSFSTNEIMLILVINDKDFKYKNELVEFLKTKGLEISTIAINVNIKNTNVILGDKNIIISGRGYIVDYIGDFKFKISPNSFYQINSAQTKILYEKALEFADLTGDEEVLDLYCGTGTISLFLSQKAKSVLGVEIVQTALEDAIQNAADNNVTNTKFICGAAEDVVNAGIKADVVVVDPPRKGCEKALLDTIGKIAPKRIIYVSCNPSTLARDLKILVEMGYSVKKAQPVDMFPQTHHVEVVTLLVRE